MVALRTLIASAFLVLAAAPLAATDGTRYGDELYEPRLRQPGNQDFSAATVVTLYLRPELNAQLRPQILRLKPGTRVVSHLWDVGEWEADESFRVADSAAYLWVVPADVAGHWTLRSADGFLDADVEIRQQFQRVGGTLTARGRTRPLLGAYLQGEILGFTFVHHDGGARSVRARVDGNTLTGSLRFAGTLTSLTGRRR